MKFKKGDIVKHTQDNCKSWEYRVLEIQGNTLVLEVSRCPNGSAMMGKIWSCHFKWLYLKDQHHNHPATKLFK